MSNALAILKQADQPTETLEQELITKFRQTWEHRFVFSKKNRFLMYKEALQPRLDSIRALRKNQRDYPDKFLVASKGYYFYRAQVYIMEKEGNIYADEMKHVFERDLGIARMFRNELRTLLTTPFKQFVTISVPLVNSMYQELDTSFLPAPLLKQISGGPGSLETH